MNQIEAVVLAYAPSKSCAPLPSSIPQCLYPLQNETLLSHAIRNIMSAGVHLPIHIFVSKEHEELIEAHLKTLPPPPEVVCKGPYYKLSIFEGDVYDDVTPITRLKYSIKRDVLVLKPQLLLDGIDFQVMLDKSIVQNASCMIASRLKRDKEKNDIVSLPGIHLKSEHDMLGNFDAIQYQHVLGLEALVESVPDIDASARRIVHCQPMGANANDFHPAMAHAFPNLTLTHAEELLPCILLKNYTIQLIEQLRENQNIQSMLDDVVPRLINAQNRQFLSSLHAESTKDKEPILPKQWWQRGSWCTSRSHLSTSLLGAQGHTQNGLEVLEDCKLRCFRFFVGRAGSLLSMNAQSIVGYILCVETLRDSFAKLCSENRYENIYESYVGQNFFISGVGTLKKSTVGNSVAIGKKCRIINSLIMNNVRIFDNCTIINTILCSGSIVKEHTTLSDCIVGFSSSVDRNSKQEFITNT